MCTSAAAFQAAAFFLQSAVFQSWERSIVRHGRAGITSSAKDEEGPKRGLDCPLWTKICTCAKSANPPLLEAKSVEMFLTPKVEYGKILGMERSSCFLSPPPSCFRMRGQELTALVVRAISPLSNSKKAKTDSSGMGLLRFYGR